tara:strand:+ start:2941 stop:3930 length:990 start_codon:yes stop_codon:yes gene_type:complete
MRFNPNEPIVDTEYPHEDLMDSYNTSCYNWQPDMKDKILRITKSSVGTFDFCPKQYYFQNILGLRGEERDYHIRGSNVHDAVEYFWKEVPKHLDDILKELKDGNIESAKSIQKQVLPTPPEPYEYGEGVQLSKYLDWQMERLQNIPYEAASDWLPIGNETEVHATRIVVASDGTEVPIHMKGYIDRIFIDDAHTGIVLMELKTGKWVEKGGRKRASMRSEMQFYRMMLEHSPHMEFLPVVGWGWQYPGGGINGGDGPKWDYESVKGPGGRYAPKTVEKRLKRVVDAHLNNDFPAEAHEAKCEYCDFMEMCPAWMGDYAMEKEVIPHDHD